MKISLLRLVLLTSLILTFFFHNSLLGQPLNSDLGNWDLSDIYSNWKAWETDTKIAKKEVFEVTKFKGTLNSSPENLVAFFNTQNKLSIRLTQLYGYVIQSKDVDNKNTEIDSYYQQLMNLYNEVEKDLVWTENELNEIPEGKLDKWLAENINLRPYKHYFSKIKRKKEHILPTDKQLLISKLGKTFGVSEDVYLALMRADREYDKITINGEELTISPVQLEKIITFNKNQTERELAYDAYTFYLEKNKNTLANIYKGLLDTRSAIADIHGYPSCLESVLFNNNIPKSIYTNLIEVAKQNTKSLQRYHELRKEFLGLEAYNAWDKRLLLFEEDSKTYTYEEAKSLVSKALNVLGKDYGNHLEKCLTNNWIDVYEKPGKRHGAYSINLFSVHPYILLNFGGTRRNIFTLAHELGHSVHSQYSNENQDYINHNYPIFLAEIASITNEHFLLDYLIEQAVTPKEKIALIIQGIENLEGKFYSNVARAEFEYETHRLAENNEVINAEILGDLNTSILNSYYGNSISRKDKHKYSWPIVHHYYTKYFYVYQYATSYAASLYFFDKINSASDEKSKDVAIDEYLTLLKSGGSDYPIDLLKKAGLDMTSNAPYLAVVKRIDTLVSLLETELAKF